MFGADTLDRRYGLTPPDSWRDTFDRMPHVELQRGLRRLSFSGARHLPTLPEFVKLCRVVGDDQEFGGAKQTQSLTHERRVTDEWGAVANAHLMAEVYKNPRRFRPPHGVAITEILVRWKNEWARLMREATAEDREPSAQKSLWRACMNQAEAEIAEMLAPEAA